MMQKIAINGRFLARRQTGQERFAKETIIELDKIINKGVIVLVVPEEAKCIISLNNIDIIKYGRHRGHLWEQLDFGPYTKKNKLLTLNLCTIQPLLNPGIVCIHDISYKINPQYFRTAYGRLSALWHRINYSIAAKRSPVILTVTETAKREIIKEYAIEHKRIVVVPNGWEHVRRIQENRGIFQKLPDLEIDNYYLSIGSLMPNKNIKWIFEVARYNLDCQFVVVGDVSFIKYGIKPENVKNVIITGYVEDGELISLMKGCKALIFPSLYEGFGIPPLEALALGKQAIISNAGCLPEVFKDYVHYIDPNNPKVRIQDVLNESVREPSELLDNYRYYKTAAIIYRVINNVLSDIDEE